ncbi:hypothetical protein [Pseudosporangium ferrugineum]|uniref:hypothetical protein n=1 Tax=Pseudosporangium ferrugineum TaxID=439699 RepID=UPI0011B26681|nr:hypothetical protein [Pseudosporangium ferrugineum]
MATALAIIAVAISIAALSVSIWTALINRRNAVAAEDSAVSARLAAEAAKESARHSEKSSESAAVVAHAETQRDHRALRPEPPLQESMLRRKHNSRTHVSGRFLVFTPQRTFRVAGDALIGESRRPLSLGPVIEGGREVEVYLDEGARGPQVEAVNLRFWPALAGDPGEEWACQCGRNTDPSGSPHWEWAITIPPQRKPSAVF